MRPKATLCNAPAAPETSLLLAAQVTSAVQTDDSSSAEDSCTREQQQGPVSQQTTDACTASTGSQTETTGLDAATGVVASRAAQTMVVTVKDTGSHAGTHGAADKCVVTDSTAATGPSCGDSCSQQTAAGADVEIASAAAPSIVPQHPALKTGSDDDATVRNKAAKVRQLATDTAQTATRVSALVQTKEIVTPAATSGRADTLLDAFLGMLARQQVPLLSPELRYGLQGHSAEVQTDCLKALQSHDSPVALQARNGPDEAPDTDTKLRAPHSRRLSLDCAETSASGAPAVAAAAEQLALPDMQAAAARQPLIGDGMTDGESVILGSSRSEDNESPVQHRSPMTSAALSADMPSVPCTPRRRIHRHLWRSGRTDEWADLLAAHNGDGWAPETSSSASTADEGRSSVGSLSSNTTSSVSASCNSVLDGSVPSGAPAALTVACQTSLSGRYMFEVCTEDTESCSSGSDCSSLCCAPSARAAACQTLQTGRLVVPIGEALLCTDLRAHSSGSGEISSWPTSLTLTAS